MQKFIFFFCFCLLIQSQVCAYTLKAGVVYTIEMARIEAFDDVPLKINIDKYKNYLIDPNYSKNISAIKINKYKFRKRYLTYFSNNQYGVTYKNNTKIGFYYDMNGKLCDISLLMNEKYPIKIVKYDILGNLVSTSLAISHDESFVFDLNKRLISHWIGNNCYNEQGELVKRRYNNK